MGLWKSISLLLGVRRRFRRPRLSSRYLTYSLSGLRLEIDVHLVSRGADGYDVVSSARRISVNLPEEALLPSVAPAGIAGIINPFALPSPANGAAPSARAEGGVARGGGFEDISDAEEVRHFVLFVFLSNLNCQAA